MPSTGGGGGDDVTSVRWIIVVLMLSCVFGICIFELSGQFIGLYGASMTTASSDF